MKIGIMQPYFFPYIGYFQLIVAVDQFVVYDNIKYTKKGWINRNRMLLNGSASTFSLPIEKGQDFLDIVQRQISSEFDPKKLLSQLKGAYFHAPYFDKVYKLLEEIIYYADRNLFLYIYHTLIATCRHLNIKTNILISSCIAIDHELKSQEKVIAICKALGADSYINTMGGVALYSKEEFRVNDIRLNFIKPNPFEYPQLGDEFVPWLSIIDVLMFNSPDKINTVIHSGYQIVEEV